MNNFLRVVIFLTLLKSSFQQNPFGKSGDLPGGILSEVRHFIINGTIEHFAGCKSHDNFTEQDIAYYLFTRKNENRTKLTLDNLHELNITKDVKILFGGWLQTTWDPLIVNLKKAYLTRYDCNVICVEYINFTNTQYTQAYCNLLKASEMMGDFFCAMHRKGHLDFNRVHMAGLSLGGHLMGLIGQRVQKICNQKVDRITGLDPAGAIYQNQDISMRLDKSDANFVDVIHTNMGMNGYYGSLGHVDFFPNCGSVQPGCMQFESFLNITSEILNSASCSHSRSLILFTESVYGPIFNSTSCSFCPNSEGIGLCVIPDLINPKYTIMGEDCPRNPPAERFYIKTNSKQPYAKG